jgi:hypothetical protein
MVGRGELTGKSSSSCRWSNIPLPKPHVVGLLASGVLHLARSWRLPESRQLHSGVGWPLVGASENSILLDRGDGVALLPCESGYRTPRVSYSYPSASVRSHRRRSAPCMRG